VEFRREEFGVMTADTVDNHRANIADERRTDSQRELIEKLIGDNEMEPEFAGFRKERRKHIGRDRLGLIDRYVERPPCCWWDLRAFHRNELQMRCKKRSEQVGCFFTDPTLIEINDKNTPAIHRE
jgi:hypothetical protein